LKKYLLVRHGLAATKNRKPTARRQLDGTTCKLV
jgi:hypothetical protein